MSRARACPPKGTGHAFRKIRAPHPMGKAYSKIGSKLPFPNCLFLYASCQLNFLFLLGVPSKKEDPWTLQSASNFIVCPSMLHLRVKLWVFMIMTSLVLT
jgi:hypothetical protein